VEAIEIYLTQEGYRILKAYDGTEALEMLEREEVHLLLLDVMMPKLDGIRATLKIREKNSIPIIILSAKSEDADKILGLNVGADDYVTKPFKLGELCSRIRALLRRAGVTPQDKASVLKCGDISIDFLSCRVILNNKILELTNAEYRLLCLLVRNANRIVSRDIILNDLWDGTGNFVDDNTLSVYIRRLREKVETDASHPQRLITIRGFGYQWKEV
jgi:two-component system response regulator RegX3